MTTLRRIIKQVKDLGYPLTEDDYLRCFKEWLQQKQKYYKVARYDKAIIDELLEELK